MIIIVHCTFFCSKSAYQSFQEVVNTFGEGAAGKLREALKTNDTLTSLDLEGCLDWANQNDKSYQEREIVILMNIIIECRMGIRGARIFSDALRINSSLTSLNLRGKSGVMIVSKGGQFFLNRKSTL